MDSNLEPCVSPKIITIKRNIQYINTNSQSKEREEVYREKKIKVNKRKDSGVSFYHGG